MTIIVLLGNKKRVFNNSVNFYKSSYNLLTQFALINTYMNYIFKIKRVFSNILSIFILFYKGLELSKFFSTLNVIYD